MHEVTDLPVKYVVTPTTTATIRAATLGYINIAEIIAHQNARDNMIRGDQPSPPRVVFTTKPPCISGVSRCGPIHFGRGHTNGDAVVYFPDLRTVHAGDLLHGIAPFIDYANGGSSREWVTTWTRFWP